MSQDEKCEIYESIHKKNPIKLCKKFLVDFSIEEYREIYSLNKEDVVDIYFDFILDCFFCSCKKECIDFSFCNFNAPDDIAGIDMNNNYFFNTNLKFSYSNFFNFDLSLTDCIFHNSKVEFIHSKFGNQDILFNRTIFKGNNCKIEFYGSILGDKGELEFSDMSMDGIIELNNVSYGNKRLSFFEMDCKNGSVYFIDSEFSSMPVEFVDSYIDNILLYKINSNNVLNFKIASANNIIVQECVIRDCILLGNSGYKNYTSYCLKDTTILGKIKIENKFSKCLFNKQKQYKYDPRINRFVFCDTSFNDKADQMMLLAEIFRAEGNSNSGDFADSAYRLSKRYKSLGRVEECIYDFPAVGRTEGYNEKFFKRIWAYITITMRLIIACISYVFEKIFLDIFCGNYATKPSRFLFWISTQIAGFAFIYALISKNNGIVNCFDISGTLYETMDQTIFYLLYSVLIYFQIEFSDILILNSDIFYIALLEKIIGLAVFTLFAVSFTRKVIK